MVNWKDFEPSNFEYDFEQDKLAAHRITFNEAVECFFYRPHNHTVANMTAKRKSMKTKLSEGEIDEIVEAQADNDSAWETPIRVRRRKSTSLRLPAKLAARAAFLARLHREAAVDDWLTRIIRERIELEEVAFAAAKRDMSVKGKSKGRAYIYN